MWFFAVKTWVGGGVKNAVIRYYIAINFTNEMAKFRQEGINITKQTVSVSNDLIFCSKKPGWGC